MSIHINAKPGEIAETVLLPGDPLRAKAIAEVFLEDVIEYSNIRGMLGFTGTYQGVRVSVQGTGMGMPSASIYIHELIQEYQVKNLIRVGTAGAIQPHLSLGSLVLAMGACTDSGIISKRVQNNTFAGIPDFHLAVTIFELSKKLSIPLYAGNILSTDTFYADDTLETLSLWAKYGILAVEMETAELYQISARYQVKALSLLSISDKVFTGEKTGPMERQKNFKDMISLTLELLPSLSI